MDLNNKYFVVRFLEKPYSAIDSEVCVPFNWVKVSKKTNDIISVAYPAEYSPSTRELVRNICTKRDEWHCYKAQVKCGKRSFEAAERFIKSRNQTNPKSEKTESSTAEINESKSGFNINSSSSKENSSPSLATKNPILRNNQSDSIKLSVKRLMTNISLNDLLNKPMKTVKTSELISETPNHSNGSGKNFCENKLVSLELDCLNQNQHDTTDVKMSDFVSNIVEQTVLESSTENKSSSIPTSHYCHTHLHRSRARHFDSLHHNLQSQNQPEPSSAKVQILEEKIMVTSNSNVANPLSEAFSHNNQLFKVNRPISYSDKHQREISIERSLNAYDNFQEMCPNITTITYPSALYRLREKISQKPLLLSHQHNEQLLTIKAMDINQKPRTQIIHRPGEMNPINDRIYPQSALDQEARTQIVIDESTEMNPIEQSDSSKITTRKVLNTLESLERNRHNPVTVTSIYFKNPQFNEINAPFERAPRKSRLNSEIPIETINMNKNSQNQEIRENTPTAEQNCSSSSNQSSCPWNGFSGKESSRVTQEQFISDPRHQQRHIGKPSKLNYTEKSIYFKNNTNNETSSVQSTPNTNHQYKPIKKYCKKNHLLAYEHDIQEQFLPNSEDFPYQEMHTEEIASEKMSENKHIVKTAYPEINTEQESKIPNLSNSIYALPKVKIQLNRAFEQMLIDRYLSVQQNNTTESVLQELPVKAEEKSARNENKKTNLDLNYVADDSDEDDDDNDDSNYSDYCVDNKHKDDINENDSGLCVLPKKKRGKKRSFVLPPEYNPHDSRWTLKYQAKEPGVVELVPHSKIYISDLQLANCKREANDYKTFGRKLLVEVFSRNALSVCSLTGARANAFDVYDSDIRPGLDKEARSTLLTYVQKYGREQGWGQFDTQSVVNSLRNKIQDFRYKYGSTV